jgi:hypothetical protein
MIISQFFSIQEAIGHIGRRVRVVSSAALGESHLPLGLVGEVRALRPAGPGGYTIGVAWGDPARAGSECILTYFDRVEYEGWLEEIQIEEEAA